MTSSTSTLAKMEIPPRHIPLTLALIYKTMNQTTEIINRVLPMLFLIFLGQWIRWRNFLAESTIDDLRKIAVNLALPAVLFTSFLRIEFKSSYLVLFVLVFSLCESLFWLGQWLKRKLNLPYIYFPFVMTGFEYGMLGISLFASAYGLDKIGYIAIVDLGHEIFIWFVFLALLLMKRDGLQNPRELVQTFFKSPVIVAILLGIFFNTIGVQETIYLTYFLLTPLTISCLTWPSLALLCRLD